MAFSRSVVPLVMYVRLAGFSRMNLSTRGSCVSLR